MAADGDITAEEHEVTLDEERPVVQKEVLPPSSEPKTGRDAPKR